LEIKHISSINVPDLWIEEYMVLKDWVVELVTNYIVSMMEVVMMMMMTLLACLPACLPRLHD
jgi:hypothetical protein